MVIISSAFTITTVNKVNICIYTIHRFLHILQRHEEMIDFKKWLLKMHEYSTFKRFSVLFIKRIIVLSDNFNIINDGLVWSN